MAQRPIDHFEFADGTVLSYEELLARGFDLEGSDYTNSRNRRVANDAVWEMRA